MTRLLKLIRDRSGVSAIEFALAFPIFIQMIWMIFQAGFVFQAVSGMQHALGEGARYATIYPRPSTAAIKQRIYDRVYGTSGVGTFTVADPTPGPTATAATSLILSVSYTQATSLLIVPGPTISLTRTKQVWIAD
jgi:Flp pilus assembly protein TadG